MSDFNCKGCNGEFDELSDDGYCESCQYQCEANLDALTDGKL